MTESTESAGRPVSRAWGDFAVTSSWDALPVTTRTMARHALADAVGSALAGARSDPVERLVAAFTDLGLTGHVAVLGRSETWSPAIAATVTGTAIRAAGPGLGGVDDPVTHFRPAPSVGAAAISAGTSSGVLLGELLTAIAVGVEVGCRLADALEPGHSARGWDLDSTVGHVAAAVAAARLFRLGSSRTAQAIAVAATEAAGHRGQGSTPAAAVQTGMAAGDAVEAALLADRGFLGPPLSIEGRRGLLALMGDHIDLDAAASALGEGLGARWVSDRLALAGAGEGHGAVLERLLTESPETPLASILAVVGR